MLENKTFNWILDQMEKISKNKCETFIIDFNLQEKSLFWIQIVVIPYLILNPLFLYSHMS
jgi:cytochrome b subunit of formate dehydrogenase